MKRLFDILRLALGVSWVLSTSGVLVVLLILLIPWRRRRISLCNGYGKFISPVVLRLARAKVRFEGREIIDANRPAIYVSNHTSMTDIFLGMWMCPYAGVGIAKREVGNVPFFGWAYRLSGHLLIDRGNRERAIESMQELADTVREYTLSIWMWPEGTRSKDGRLKSLKKGVGHLAIATGRPIVPVMVHGAHRNWKTRTVMDIRTSEVLVKVLPPMPTTAWSVETLEEHLKDLQAYMASALPEDQKPLPSEPGDIAV